MKNVLITGVTGFAGSHLAEYYLKHYEEYEIFGLVRWRSPLDNIQGFMNHPKFHLVHGDIVDSDSIMELITKSDFDIIHHLAAQSFVPDSWTMGNKTLTVNVNGTYNILHAVAKLDKKPIVHLAGSSEEYGLVYPEETPITEENELRPRSPYAVSKIATEYLGMQMSQSFKIPVVVTRAFNHCGERRGSVFVCSNFAMQIAKFKKYENKGEMTLKVGDITAIRDFTDVRDMVRGYVRAVEFLSGEGENHLLYIMFNIATGIGYSIEEVIRKLEKISGCKINIEVEKDRLRPSDVPILIGDASYFKSLTNWEPEYSFDDTLKSIYDYWWHKI